MSPRASAAAFILAALALAPALSAQPADPPAGDLEQAPETRPSDRRRPADASAMPDRDAVRARLARRLDDVRQMEARLETALEKIDAGAPIGRALRDLGGIGRLLGGDWVRGGEGENQRPGPEDRERATAFLKDRLPEVWSRLAQVREVDPDAADRMLGHLIPRVREAFFAVRQDPGSFELLREEMQSGLAVFDATIALRQAKVAGDETSLAGARQSLRAALERQYDARSRLQQRRVETLEKEIAALRARLDEAAQNRETLISTRVEATEANASGPMLPDDPKGPRGGRLHQHADPAPDRQPRRDP